MLDEASRSLPPAVLYPTTALLFLALMWAMTRTPHTSGRLLLAVIWLRYVMQAFHEVTYQSIGGVSVNALGSLAVCIVGAAVLFRELPRLGRFPVLLSLVGVIALSGLVNGVIIPTVETLCKWGYFAIVLLALQDCLARDGDARILRRLLWAFAPPLVYQAQSFALGIGKATESDGSISYIGGYSHEAAFSIVLVTCFAIAALAPRLNLFVRQAILGACLVGILAANYRTSLIAVAPIAFGYFVFGAARSAAPGHRLMISLVGLAVMAAAVVAASVLMADRLSDLGVMAEGMGDLIRPPDDFTMTERDLMSGRLYLWNAYFDTYSAGSDIQLLLGNGADSWIDVFGLYAHNTLVSYLFEFGIAGTALVLLVWLAMIVRAFRIQDWALRGQMVCTHVGFVLLSMATMPFWQIEGLILYALLCGYTCASSTVRRPVRPWRPPEGRRSTAAKPYVQRRA